MILICPVTGGVHLDNVIKVMSARLLHYDVLFSFVSNRCFLKASRLKLSLF